MKANSVLHFVTLLTLLSCLACLSCGQQKKQQGIAQSDWEKLIAIRTEAKQLYTDLTTEQFVADSAGRPLRTEEVFTRCQGLLDEKNVKLVQRIQDSYQPSPEERQVRLLRQYLILCGLKLTTGQSTDYLRGLHSENPIQNGKRAIEFRQLPELMANERDRTRRAELYEAQLPILVKVSAVYEKIRAQEDSLLLIYGYGDMSSFLEEIQACDLALLSRQAERFITETDSLTHALFSELAPKLTGVKAEAFRGYDLPVLERGAVFDKNFPATKVIEGLRAALTGMGVFLDSFPGIKIHQAGSATGSVRPSTYPIRIPDDVRLLLPLTEGTAAYSAVYHEIGHALRCASTTEKDFEFAYLDAQTLSETSAFLIEQLLDQPAFLQGRLGFSQTESRNYLKYRALTKLITIRSYCGDLLYQQSLYSNLEEAKSAYEQIKQPLLGYPWSDADREQYLSRADYLESAAYLRGWFLAAQIQEKLKSTATDDYWTRPATGEFLRKIWMSGSRYSPEEIAQSLGITSIEFGALLNQIRQMIS